MSIYQKYSTEILDDKGNLQNLILDYPDNFNFAYDVVDVIAEDMPEKTALVWCNTEQEEHSGT